MDYHMPGLKYLDNISEFQKRIINDSYEKVKIIIENYEGEGVPDFDLLMSAAIENEKELYQKRDELIKEVVNDPNKMTSDWLLKNQDVLKIIESIEPYFLGKVQAIEAHEDVSCKQKIHTKNRGLYIFFCTILGIAIYPFWGGVIGFGVGYMIWHYTQPKYIADKLPKNNKK